MKKLFNKNNITNLIISIIGSVIFMQIVTPGMQIIKNMGSGIIKALVDYYYFSCGQASSTEFVSTVAYIILIVVICLLMSLLSAIASPPDTKKSHQEREDYKQKNINEDNLSKTPDELEEDILTIESKVTYLLEKTEEIEAKKINSKKRQALVARVLIMLVAFYFAMIIAYEYSPLFRKEDFDRRIIQITPYVDDAEIAHLNADWVSMKTKNDYLLLQDRLQSIMDANGIK